MVSHALSLHSKVLSVYSMFWAAILTQHGWCVGAERWDREGCEPSRVPIPPSAKPICLPTHIALKLIIASHGKQHDCHLALDSQPNTQVHSHSQTGATSGIAIVPYLLGNCAQGSCLWLHLLEPYNHARPSYYSLNNGHLSSAVMAEQRETQGSQKKKQSPCLFWPLLSSWSLTHRCLLRCLSWSGRPAVACCLFCLALTQIQAAKT